MDLLKQTQELCRVYGINPSRSKGQNFLIREDVYDQIVAAAELSSDDTVLEVGPGLGFLTAKLAKQVQRVLAVELDDKMAAFLKTALDSQSVTKVEVFNQDILKFDQRILGKYKIVANLPYNISSFFLRSFLSGGHKPEMLVLMLQKEVAERLTATAPDMNLLALSVQYYAQPEIIAAVPAEAFWPRPKVDSAIVKISVSTTRTLDEAQEEKFFRLARIGFSAKRKMLKNNLAGGLKIDTAELEKRLVNIGLSPKVRAEDLSLPDWQKLFAAVSDFML